MPLSDLSSLPPLVAVVIPTHNRRDRLLACLEHLRAQEAVSFRPIAVFDGCTDGSQDAVREQFPEVLAVEGDGNLWWSGSINAGIKSALALGVKYVCLLNDDVQPAPGMLAALVLAARDRPGAVVGPLICCLHDPERIWSVGGVTNWLRSGTAMRATQQLPDEWGNVPLEVHWLPGMGTLIPVTVFEIIGVMDERNLPQYFADADFCLRARRQGIPILLCPQARLYNDVRSTGVLLPSGPIEWRTVVAVFCSRRSHSQWLTRWRFWRRHCPLPLLPWQVVRFYVPVLAAMAKKLTWDRMRWPLVNAHPTDHG
jgi:GT2 family glycosyltransferase